MQPIAVRLAFEFSGEAEFLDKKIGFLEMSDIIMQTISKIEYVSKPDLSDYINFDNKSRKIAKELIYNG